VPRSNHRPMPPKARKSRAVTKDSVIVLMSSEAVRPWDIHVQRMTVRRFLAAKNKYAREQGQEWKADFGVTDAEVVGKLRDFAKASNFVVLTADHETYTNVVSADPFDHGSVQNQDRVLMALMSALVPFTEPDTTDPKVAPVLTLYKIVGGA